MGGLDWAVRVACPSVSLMAIPEITQQFLGGDSGEQHTFGFVPKGSQLVRRGLPNRLEVLGAFGFYSTVVKDELAREINVFTTL